MDSNHDLGHRSSLRSETLCHPASGVSRGVSGQAIEPVHLPRPLSFVKGFELSLRPQEDDLSSPPDLLDEGFPKCSKMARPGTSLGRASGRRSGISQRWRWRWPARWACCRSCRWSACPRCRTSHPWLAGRRPASSARPWPPCHCRPG